MNGNRWREKIRILKQSFRMMGLWLTLRYLIIRILLYLPGRDARFDKKYGTDTTGKSFPGDFSGFRKKAKQNANFYLPAPERVTEHMIASLDVDHEKFLYIDFGSGKGRALLVASAFPFEKIIGVEISEELHAVAERNVKVYKNPAQRCSHFELHCQDAASFEIPEKPAVFYFYHPFFQEVLRSVLTNIERSLKMAPRRVYILYLFHNDRVENVFHEMASFEKIYEEQCINPNYSWALYSNAGGGS